MQNNNGKQKINLGSVVEDMCWGSDTSYRQQQIEQMVKRKRMRNKNKAK